MQAYRSSILHFLDKPTADGQSVDYYEDGLLLVNEGHIVEVGDYLSLSQSIDQAIPVTDYQGKLITPGFIDTHIHFPQIDVIASYGEQLLDWLNNYTFPAEQRFESEDYALKTANLFIDELQKNGTTTALAYGTVHPQSVNAFFTVSEQRNTRMIAGKVMMDRNAPEALTDTVESGERDTRSLIERWHGQGRQSYAVTPRFAPTSTPEQLAAAGRILADYDDLFMQTHLSENLGEIAWVKELYPERASYLDVYDHYGLLSERSVFGHGIHLDEAELNRLSDSGASIAFCPTSNQFLGSGLLDIQRLQNFNVDFSVATDVGAGTSFSQLQTLNEAYKIGQLNHYKLHPYEAFYWLTLGNAKTLRLDDRIGNFEAGKEADFLVLDYSATTLLEYRSQQVSKLWEKLFLLMIMGDDRAINKTYVAGELAHSRGTK